jgi:hypothetical protein
MRAKTSRVSVFKSQMLAVVCLLQMFRQLPELREQVSFILRILYTVDSGGYHGIPTWAKLELVSSEEC